jgi:hypothetical protein
MDIHFINHSKVTNPTVSSATNDCHRGRVISPHNSVISSEDSQTTMNPFGVSSILKGIGPFIPLPIMIR